MYVFQNYDNWKFFSPVFVIFVFQIVLEFLIIFLPFNSKFMFERAKSVDPIMSSVIQFANWAQNQIELFFQMDFFLQKTLKVFLSLLKWRSATRDFILMFWIIANDCACLMIYLFPECLVNKLNYGILHQLPAISNPNSKHSL